MKKLSSLICLILAALLLVLHVCAEETAPVEDSVTISEEIRTSLNLEAGDTVLRIYQFDRDFRLSGFPKYRNIDKVLAHAEELSIRGYFFVTDATGETKAYTHFGDRLVGADYVSEKDSPWVDFHLNGRAEAIIKKVSADIVVENIYFLRYDHMAAVYYKTNLGEYVYFVFSTRPASTEPDAQCKEEYLMRLDHFLQLQEAIYYHRFLWQNAEYVIPEVRYPAPTPKNLRVDLSVYEFASPDFAPDAAYTTYYSPGKFIAIGSVVLLVGLIVCRLFIRNRRKNRITKEEMVNRI